MKWVTRQHLHFDRAAVPWLIKRFVDRDATFVFVPWGEEDRRPDDAIPFAIPGAELGPHDDAGSTFRKVATKYRIDDPAVGQMAHMIDFGIRAFLHHARPDPDDEVAPLAAGVLAICEGIMLGHPDDDAILAASLPVWDALYTALRAKWLIESRRLTVPPACGKGPSAKVAFVRALLAREAPPRPPG